MTGVQTCALPIYILSACSGSTVYDEYAHTPIAGWEKNDTLSFEVSPLLEPGHYKQSLPRYSKSLVNTRYNELGKQAVVMVKK